MSRLMLCPWTGKKIYWTLAAVRRLAAIAKLKYYKCKHCSYYHFYGGRDE